MGRIQHILKVLLDFFLPESRYAKLAAELSPEILKDKAHPRHIGDMTFVLFHMKDKLIRKSMWALKYHNQTSLADSFGAVLYEHILDELADELLFEDFSEPLLIPIPLSKGRLRLRGYNQSDLIAQSLCMLDSSRSFTLCSDVLIRVKENESQTRMRDRKSREENIKGVFSVRNKDKIKKRNIILLDDVVTTGATMREAKNTLLQAGVQNVYCVALAH